MPPPLALLAMAGLSCRYSGSPVGDIVGDAKAPPPDISNEWAKDARLLDVVMRIVGDGGLVTQSHPHTVRIVDCRMWRSEHAALLLLLRPRAAVSVTGCGDSLTGFEVRRRISKATSFLLCYLGR